MRPLDTGRHVRGQYRGYRQAQGVAAQFDHGDVRSRAPQHRDVALGRRAVLRPVRQVPAGHRHRGARPAAPRAGRPHRGEAPWQRQPPALPHRSEARNRPRGADEGARRGTLLAATSSSTYRASPARCLRRTTDCSARRSRVISRHSRVGMPSRRRGAWWTRSLATRCRQRRTTQARGARLEAQG